jgi:hypothetical protein
VWFTTGKLSIFIKKEMVDGLAAMGKEFETRILNI